MQLWVQWVRQKYLGKYFIWKSGYEITGELKYQGKDLNDIPVEERAQKEFLAFNIR